MDEVVQWFWNWFFFILYLAIISSYYYYLSILKRFTALLALKSCQFVVFLILRIYYNHYDFICWDIYDPWNWDCDLLNIALIYICLGVQLKWSRDSYVVAMLLDIIGAYPIISRRMFVCSYASINKLRCMAAKAGFYYVNGVMVWFRRTLFVCMNVSSRYWFLSTWVSNRCADI